MVGFCEAKKKAEMRDPIWEAGQKHIFRRDWRGFIATKRHKMYKKDKKIAKKVLFGAIPAKLATV